MFGTFHATRFNGDGDLDGDDPDKLTAYRFIFIFFSALSTLYTYSWDIRMDWRLGKCAHKGLRFRMLYVVFDRTSHSNVHLFSHSNTGTIQNRSTT